MKNAGTWPYENGFWLGNTFLGVAWGGWAWGFHKYETDYGEPMIAACFGKLAFAAGRLRALQD